MASQKTTQDAASDQQSPVSKCAGPCFIFVYAKSAFLAVVTVTTPLTG